MKIFMDYTVLTTHTEAAPFSDTIKVDKGIITKLGVYFPPGCHGRVYAKILFQTHQVLPRTQESWCRGNNGWWSGDTNIAVTDAPLTIKTIAWSNGCLYDHTITIEVEISPFTLSPKWDEVISFLTALKQALGIEVAEVG